MAHGGTNFGFYNGANTGQADSDYKADLTSYDYVSTNKNITSVLFKQVMDLYINFVIQDAPIKEDGDVKNPKFRGMFFAVLS